MKDWMLSRLNFGQNEVFCCPTCNVALISVIFFSVQGVTRFLSSLVPLGFGTGIEKSGAEWTAELNTEEINMLYSWASLSDGAVVDRIRSYHNLAYELAISEAHEMMRGNLLQVFHPSGRSHHFS